MVTYSIEISEPAENDLRDMIIYISSHVITNDGHEYDGYD